MEALVLYVGFLPEGCGDPDDDFRISIGTPDVGNHKEIIFRFEEGGDELIVFKSTLDNIEENTTIYKSESLIGELWEADSNLWKTIANLASSLTDNKFTIHASRLQAMYSYINDEDYDEKILGEVKDVCHDDNEDWGEFFMDEEFNNKFFLRVLNAECNDEGYIEEGYDGLGIVAL